MQANQGMNPRDQKRLLLEAELAFVESTAAGLQQRLSFADVLGEIHQRVQSLGAIEEKLKRARARGYVYGAELEPKLEASRRGATTAAETARTESEKVARSLASRVQSLQRDIGKVAGGDVLRNEGAIGSVAQEVRAVASAIEGAEKRVRELAAPFTAVVDELSHKLDAAHWMLDQFESASFKQQPEENPLACFKAVWEDPPGGSKLEGMLFLTDLRMRFEGQEEVVVERTFLFFKSRSEWHKKLMSDVPVGNVLSSDDSERGLIIKDQLLTLSFRNAQNVVQRATFELKDVGARSVDTLVEQLRTGDMLRQRYNGPMPEGSNVGVPVRWPTQCANCGAALTPPVKGQTLITCEYCNARFEVTLGQG